MQDRTKKKKKREHLAHIRTYNRLSNRTKAEENPWLLKNCVQYGQQVCCRNYK